ncbi:MAG: DUF1559 domain-containing protein [Planctomycetota bacterium]|jgi:prepilin-type processing-associated H-X9-DG protein
MNVIGLGFAELIIILGLGGGFGLPLGIPPAQEDPRMAKVAPEECLFYTTWAGMAKPDPGSTNQTEQLLAEPEVQHLVTELERRLKTGLQQLAAQEGPQEAAMAEDGIRWVKKLLTSPTAVFVSSVTVARDGPPDVRGGALVRVGEDAAQLKAALEKYRQMLPPEAVRAVQIDGDGFYRITPDPKAPQITLGVKGNYFMLGVGEGSVEGIISRARTPAPKWLTDVRTQLAVDRTATVAYVNVQKIMDTFVPLAGGPKASLALVATGLADVTSLASVTGLDDEGFVSRTVLGLEGEPRGLLSFAAAKPLGPADLAPIPSDATIALAARLDADSLFEAVLSAVAKIEPRAHKEMLEGLNEFRAEVGIDVRGDVLASLGDTWCVYNSPGEGGLVFTGLTAVVQLKDRQRLADAHDRLLRVVKAEIGQDEDRRGPRIEQFQFAGQTVYFFNAREAVFPVAPSWCLTEKELIVAPFPQNIKAYLSRGDQLKPIAAVPEVAALFQSADGPIMLSYFDTRKVFELVYPFVPMIAQAALGELSREGIDIDVSILPSAGAIGPHLRPAVTVLQRSEAGIELVSRQTLPGGSVGSTAPTAVALLLPAVQAAREAARRAQSMNNLKQIALSMHIHHESYGRFPAAYIADKQGKPLLSWRVKILPFIEQQALYEQFHLDEPWDSEHNKKLIPLMPQVYNAAGSNAGPGKTNYLTVRGENTAFPGAKGRRMAEIRDGTSNTIMAVEVSNQKAVIWTKPDDFEYDQQNPAAGLTGLRPGGFNAAFCDGHVRFISQGIDAEILKRLFMCNDGKVIDYEERSAPGRRRGPRTFEEIELIEEEAVAPPGATPVPPRRRQATEGEIEVELPELQPRP